jgi:hypothetical protein
MIVNYAIYNFHSPCPGIQPDCEDKEFLPENRNIERVLAKAHVRIMASSESVSHDNATAHPYVNLKTPHSRNADSIRCDGGDKLRNYHASATQLVLPTNEIISSLLPVTGEAHKC